ncbi:MAG: 50S ribosomal protein L3 [Candidatus Roizmanbacteria bacterium]
MAGIVLGYKSDLSQQFDDMGVRTPTTSVVTSACYLTAIKMADIQGYNAIKLGFGPKKSINKPQQEELNKAGIKSPLRFLREVRIDSYLKSGVMEFISEGKKQGIKIGEQEILIGDTIKPEILFEAGDRVKVTATSKGKGFQGVVKRHGFAGGSRTHGQSDRLRAPGSIGQSATPGRVFKGKRMAGRMGTETVTLKNVKIVEVTPDSIVLKGPVPGPRGTLVLIKSV